MTDEQILDAALTVFHQYGYGKTTMQDIARAARLSRAALYLHFPTKEDLFRAGTRRAHAQALARADEALAGPGDVVSRVDAAMAAYFGGLMAQIASSAHGGELFDASLSVTGDLVAESHEALVARLAGVLAEADLSTVDANAEQLARMLLAVENGLQKTSTDPKPQRALFFRVVQAAVSGSERWAL